MDHAVKTSHPSGTARKPLVTACRMLYDGCAVNAAFLLALWLRFDCRLSDIPQPLLHTWAVAAPLYAAGCIAAFRLLGRYAGCTRRRSLLVSLLLSSLYVIFTLPFSMPAACYLTGAGIQLFLVLSVQHGKNEVPTGGNHISAEKLLGREPIRLPLDESFRDLQDKVILVTGGGGSIGSELCRQIARHHPKRLLLLDICENSAHAVRLELEDRYPDLDLVVLIGSVRDSRRLDAIFSRYRPDVVYHAAAHKHVPLMEENPAEAIKNNVLGTYKTAYAAVQNGCRRFVLISTDKAVHPVGVMGASKRLCEMVIQTFDQLCREGRADELPLLRLHDGDAPVRHPLSAHPRTEFVAVRFGNVLGSSGSVLGRFEEQIARGGPVTVTHPEVVRYFMTVSEAVSLVLQAGVYAQGGEIFVLDMGPPVKIDALARSLIRLSGYRPDADIPIVYTGLRPGEKLYEEKLMAEEGLKTTPNRKIHIAAPVPLETERLLRQLPVLMEAAYDERPELCDLLAELVPTYHPSAPAPPMRVVPGQAKTGVGEYAHERYRLSG